MQKGCPKCGRMIDKNVTTCPYCNYNFKEIDNFFKRVNDEKFLENQKYAGFTKRLVAGLFDCFIILIFTYFILIAINQYLTPITLDNIYMGIYIFLPLYIIYNSIFERTSWRGSLGKYILSIEVTDEYENPVTLPKALFRNITKIFNIITLGLGFLLSAIPPKKQALNDKISKTFVINKLTMTKDDKLLYASPINRLLAFIIDVLIISLICYGLLAITDIAITQEFPKQTIDMINSAKYIICLVIILFYFPFSESRSGATIGKSLMHIKLTKQDGNVAGFITVFARELISFLNIITLGFLLPFATTKRQTLKDILTRTVVINR